MSGTSKLCLAAFLCFLAFSNAEDMNSDAETPDMEEVIDTMEAELQGLDAHPEQGSAKAAEESPGTPEVMLGMHKKMDEDGDGHLSLQEIMAYSRNIRKTISRKGLQEVAQELDTDQDGKLSWAELHIDTEEALANGRYNVALEQKKFEAADRNGDGQLNLLELSVFFTPGVDSAVLEVVASHTLAEMDQDSDGKLSSAEWANRHTEEEASEAASDVDAAEFLVVDKDSNGFVDLDEMKDWESGHSRTEQMMKKLFEHADKDGDQLITEAELEAAFEAIVGTDAHDELNLWAEHSEL